LYSQITFDLLKTDYGLAGVCLFIVFVYISIHTRSIFISFTAILSLLVSLPISLVIYKSIMGIHYFSQLHILSLFLMIGIGADDIFVFYDAWGQSNHINYMKGDIQKRMAFTFKRAAKAMLVTSLTTTGAFFATSFSSIVPISAFGYFATIIVPLNYLLAIFVLPNYIMVRELYIKKMRNKMLPNCCKRK